MRFRFVFIFGLLFCNCARVKYLSASQIKKEIDAAYYSPSSDLLPPELNELALENEYYCDSLNSKAQVYVLRLRDNRSFIAETYLKAKGWARIDYRIGDYRISGDTLQLSYKPLLRGKAGTIYLRPIWHVSFIPMNPPKYLLLDREYLFDPSSKRVFHALTDNPKFELVSLK